jgi:hypothetical protein
MVEGLSPPRPIDLRNFVATAASSSTVTETAMIRLTNTCQPSSTPHINAPHPHHRFLVSDTQIYTQTQTRTLQREASGYAALSRSDLCRPGQLPNVRHNTTQLPAPATATGLLPEKELRVYETDQPPHFDPQLPHFPYTTRSNKQIKQKQKQKKGRQKKLLEQPTQTTITTNSRDTYNAKQQLKGALVKWCLKKKRT